MAITLDANMLHAAVYLAAVKDIRFYLSGVFVEAFASSTRLVATDGLVLGVFECEHENQVSPGCSTRRRNSYRTSAGMGSRCGRSA